MADLLVNNIVSYVSSSLHNLIMVIIDDELHTAIGNAGGYSATGSGRALTNAAINQVGVMEGLAKVVFPYRTAGMKLVEAGGSGHSFNYALFDNGYLYTWGSNVYGECGLGHNSYVGYPNLANTACTKVWTKESSRSFDASQGALLVQLSDGYVYGTGNNDDGQFGFGNTTNLNSLTPLGWLGTNPKYAACDEAWGAMAIYQKADGTIWTAGAGVYGCSFTGTTTAHSTPVEVTNNIGGLSAGDIIYSNFGYGYNDAVTYSYPGTIVARRDSSGVVRVYTVGANTWGQLGNGSTPTPAGTVTPQLVGTYTDFKQIVCTGGCVRSTYIIDGTTLYAWGYNGSGQLGLGHNTPVGAPTIVDSNVKRLLMGNLTSHTYQYRNQLFYERTDGTIMCSGENSAAYLGLGHIAAVNTATVNVYLTAINKKDPIKFLGDYTTQTHGRVFLMVTESNAMYTWGFNGDYGVGGHNTNNVYIPTKINTLYGERI